MLLTLVLASLIEVVDVPPARVDAALVCYAAADVPGEDARADAAFERTKRGPLAERLSAVRVLGAMDSAHARAALAALLCGSPDPDVRAEAARALGGRDATSEFVLALAADIENDPVVRAAILAALAGREWPRLRSS